MRAAAAWSERDDDIISRFNINLESIDWFRATGTLRKSLLLSIGRFNIGHEPRHGVSPVVANP
jgi:hypothetical protein